MADNKKMTPEEKKKEVIRAIKFALFSASAGIIQFGSFTLLTLIFKSWDYMPRYLISLILSVLWNFTLNRKFTFQSANNVPIAMVKVAIFYAIFTPVTTIGGGYLVNTLGWNDFLVEILTMALNFVTEYLYDTFVVFRNSIDTAVIEKKNKEDKARETDKTE